MLSNGNSIYSTSEEFHVTPPLSYTPAEKNTLFTKEEDGQLYYIDSLGIEHQISGGGGGDPIDLTNVESDIIPATDSTYNLGSVTNKWDNVHANIANVTDLNCTGTAQIQNVSCTTLATGDVDSSLVPKFDQVYDLGLPSAKWTNLYVNNVFTDRPPEVRYNGTALQTLPSAFYLNVTWNDEEFNTNITYSSGSFTINTSGRYICGYDVSFSADPDLPTVGSARQAMITKNTTTFDPSNTVRYAHSAVTSDDQADLISVLTGTTYLDLAQGDTVQLWVYQNCGFNLTTPGASTGGRSNEFWMVKI